MTHNFRFANHFNDESMFLLGLTLSTDSYTLFGYPSHLSVGGAVMIFH